VPGSYSITLDEHPFSAWVGWLLDMERPLIFIGGSSGDLRRAQVQLLRIGYDNQLGFLEGGLEAWRDSGRETSGFPTAEMHDVLQWISDGRQLTILDVRDEHEWVHGHVPGAVHLPVPQVRRRAADLPWEAPVAVHCASGFRAGIAASLLEQAGIRQIIHVLGGYPDWQQRQLPASVPG
jgi:rhodanese-related sulfurtransferase